MAVLDHHDYSDHPSSGENFHAAMFCFAWVVFFALIGVITYIASAL